MVNWNEAYWICINLISMWLFIASGKHRLCNFIIWDYSTSWSAIIITMLSSSICLFKKTFYTHSGFSLSFSFLHDASHFSVSFQCDNFFFFCWTTWCFLSFLERNLYIMLFLITFQHVFSFGEPITSTCNDGSELFNLLWYAATKFPRSSSGIKSR